MYKVLGRLTVSHPWLVCAAWLVAGILLTMYAPTWDSRTQDDDIRFLPARCDSVRGYYLLEKAFPKEIFASKGIFAVERLDGPLTPEDFKLVDGFVQDLHELRAANPDLQIGGISSYKDGLIGSRLNSGDGKCTLIQVALNTPFLALQTRATMDRAEAKLDERLASVKDPPRVMATGPAGIGRDLIRASADSLEGTTLATVILVVVVLLLVYRAPLLALVPLITIVVSVWVALKMLAMLTWLPGVHLVNVAKIFAVVILYGSGTDYCLFLISRYQEELSNGQGLQSAISRAVSGVGGALAASAGTVICGLGLMGFAEFAKVRCAGPAIALSLGVALAASLTLAPALLSLMGRIVFWPSRIPSPEARSYGRGLRGPDSRKDPIWDRIARSVVARPMLIWSVAVLALAPFAILGLHVYPNYKPTGELSRTSPSVMGVAAIQHHFTAGEIGPLTVLLSSHTDWNTPDGRAVIAHLSRGFGHLSNVAEVRSLTQPLGKPLSPPLDSASPMMSGKGLLGGLFKTVNNALEQGAKAARDFYIAKVQSDDGLSYVTRLDVVMRSDPFGSASTNTLDEIQIWLNEHLPPQVSKLDGMKAECYGVTVSSRDLAQITEGDRVRVNSLVLAGIFLILLVLVRKPWLAAYLLITVLFSYYATLGATALFGSWWSSRPLGQVDWRVPFFLFTILIAVGEDYNIFLVSRVLEERKKHGDEEGMRRALAHTGGTITSCGLIMAGTFATLMLGGLGTLVQIGFALAFGVLIDTFIVRPFLVPALTLVVWKMQRQQAEVEPAAEEPTTRRLPMRLPRAG